MGKTSLFHHLQETHFGSNGSAFAVFRCHGYVLIPVEARRFPDALADLSRPWGWVVSCASSVLSENGLGTQDRPLLEAMFRRGTLAIAIDGLNEVGRGSAVAAFAAEFPAMPLLITSQD